MNPSEQRGKYLKEGENEKIDFLVRKKTSGRDTSIYGLEKADKIEKILSESKLHMRKNASCTKYGIFFNSPGVENHILG